MADHNSYTTPRHRAEAVLTNIFRHGGWPVIEPDGTATIVVREDMVEQFRTHAAPFVRELDESPEVAAAFAELVRTVPMFNPGRAA